MGAKSLDIIGCKFVIRDTAGDIFRVHLACNMWDLNDILLMVVNYHFFKFWVRSMAQFGVNVRTGLFHFCF